MKKKTKEKYKVIHKAGIAIFLRMKKIRKRDIKKIITKIFPKIIKKN